MKTLEQIQIKSHVNDTYRATITLARLESTYVVQVSTWRKKNGIEEKEYIAHIETYEKALHEFLENVEQYAKHTAMMNW